MKFLTILFVLCLAVTGFSQTAKDIEAFRANWEAAEKVNDTPALERLMRSEQDAAVYVILETAERAQGRPDQKVFERLELLRVTWKEVFKTDFVLEMERFFSFMDAPKRRLRGAVLENYHRIRPRLFEALEKNDVDMIVPMSTQMEDFAKRFEELGDKLYASNSWYLVGESWMEGHRAPAQVDRERAAYGFQKAVNLRKEIGLADRMAIATEDFLRRFKAEGVEASAPATDPSGPAVAAAPVTSVKVTGQPLRAPLEFEMLEELDDFGRPNFNLDAFRSMWYPAFLEEAKNNQAQVGRVKENPQFLRTGASEVHVDTNTDGEPDVEIKMTGRLTPVEFTVGQGTAEERPWGLLVIPGMEQDTYQNIEVNTSSTDTILPLYLVGGASMIGEVDGTKVQIVDEDLDAVYGSPHTFWGNIGISEGVFQPEFDSLLVGKEKQARPWSQYQQIGKQWYKLEVTAGAKALEATPVEFPTGILTLKFKGGKPTYLVVKGEGEFEHSYFDIAKGKVEVPVGRYTLYTGELRKGKKQQTMKSLILPGATTPRFTVTEGETTEVPLGAPFGFDFKFTASGSKVTVDGHTVVITGSAGERYERAWNCVSQPEISYRAPGSKRGVKGEEMVLVQSLTDGKYAYRDAWSPLTIEVEMRGLSAPVEVQLYEKKNKLFGTIESDWKEQGQ